MTNLLVQPAVHLLARRCPLEQLPLGASRFGGAPDLPPDFEWPTHRGRAITFLAQFELSQLGLPGLPTSGWLLFFYDVAEQPWGFDPLHRGGARVIYLDVARDVLLRAPHPNVESAGGPFEVCELAFTPVSTPASATEPLHHLQGEPDVLRGELWGECQLVTNGIYCGDSSGFQGKRAEGLLRTAAEEWQLLLQLDSDEAGPNWCWDTGGRIYFCIRRADLAARAFDQAWLILQTELT